MDKEILLLPQQVIGRVDVGRLLREVEALDNFMKQAAIREPGTPVKMPKTSRLLDETMTNNKLNMLHDDDRMRLKDFLTAVKAQAPVMHMSFSADPSPSFLVKLVTWLRAEIHPVVLLQVGLQPNIGAGVIVRTTNKHFDFSLRQRFKKERDHLVQKLHIMSSQQAPVVATTTITTTPAAGSYPVAVAEPKPAETPEELAKQVEAAIKAIAPASAQPATATKAEAQP